MQGGIVVSEQKLQYELIESWWKCGLLNEHALRKHAYSDMLKILQPKKENLQI